MKVGDWVRVKDWFHDRHKKKRKTVIGRIVDMTQASANEMAQYQVAHPEPRADGEVDARSWFYEMELAQIEWTDVAAKEGLLEDSLFAAEWSRTGYQYGPDALENVRLGWDLARKQKVGK